MESARLAAGKARSLIDEFKNFAFKGNVVDLAVGVIIGAAFGKIVAAMVDKIIMPLVSLLIPSDQAYTDWAWTVGDKKVLIGEFLGEILNFLIVALALYVFIVKFLGWIMHSKDAAPPPPSKQEELLMEIRDLLKTQSAQARS